VSATHAVQRKPAPKAKDAAPKGAPAFGVAPLIAPLMPKAGTCACGGGCPRCREDYPLQAKLEVSQPGDTLEQEADRVAEQVLRMPQPELPDDPEARKSPGLLLSRYSPGSPSPDFPGVPPSVRNVVRSPGEPLDAATRGFFEARFGHDFSDVRIHADRHAAKSAHSVNALAYTVGHDVVFGAGQYAPGTSKGQRLIAHELAHVTQNTMRTGTHHAVIQRDEAGRDDGAVQAHIDQALEQNSDDVGNASLSLMAKRNESTDCDDENLAAAEHYMFARWLVGELYVPAGMVTAAVVDYALFKIVAFQPYAFLNWVLGHCQATTPSTFQVKWGLKGVLHGRADRANSWTPWWW
jgi:hypothetical protein